MAFEIAGRHHLSHFCVSSVLWIRRRQGILPNLEAIQIVRIKSFYGNLCMSVFDCRQDKSFLVKRKSVLKTMRTGGREGERQRDSDRETQRERETQCAQLIVNNQNQMVWPLLKGQEGKQWWAECILEVLAFHHRAFVCWVTNKCRPISPGKAALDDTSQTFFLLILLVIAIYLFQAVWEWRKAHECRCQTFLPTSYVNVIIGFTWLSSTVEWRHPEFILISTPAHKASIGL